MSQHAFRVPVAAPAFVLSTDPANPAGTHYGVGALLGASVAASTAITGATETETNFSTTVTIPANALQAGSTLHIIAMGKYTLTTGAETNDLKLKIGSTAIVTLSGINPANDNYFAFDVWVTVRTAGASGTMVAVGTAVGAALAGTTAQSTVALDSTALDTTAAQTVAVAIDRQASATDRDSARLDMLTVVGFDLASLV